MSQRDTLKIVREDLRKKTSKICNDIKKDARNARESGGTILAGLSGAVVGAIEYSPFCFAMPTTMRRVSEKKIDFDESEASTFYRMGKYTGGFLSNLAIHGGWVVYSINSPNPIRNQLLQLGAIVGGNLASRGYEYLRSASERAKKQGDEESN